MTHVMFLRHSPFSLFMLVLPSPYFYASFLPPPATFWAVSPSSLNRSSPLKRLYEEKYNRKLENLPAT